MSRTNHLIAFKRAAAQHGTVVRANILDRKKLAVELAAAKAAIKAATAEGPEAPKTLTTEMDLLGHLDRQYGQILAALEHETELKASKEQLTIELDNLRAHGPKHVGQINDFRFFGGISQYCPAFRLNRRNHDILGARNRGNIKKDIRRFKSVHM